jgi:hypothetical protein
MLSPSLHFHYRNFITTTTKSAPNISSTSFSCLFPLAILQNDVEFTCSLKQPKYMSCPLNPPDNYRDRVFSNQVSNTLCHRCKRNHLFLTSSFAFTRLHHGFTCVQLIVFAPTEVFAPVFHLSLTTSLFPILAA